MNTQEERNLPVEHCIRGTEGWQISSALAKYNVKEPIDKVTFGSTRLGEILKEEHEKNPIQRITLIGLCTDICVISNALLFKAYLPEVPIRVDASYCGGVTPESHRTALASIKPCQIEIINEEE